MKRFKQFLNESVTFGVAEFIKDNPTFPKGLFTGQKWWRKEQGECSFCDGDGHGTEGQALVHNCVYCKGSGKVENIINDSPELNVANSNASAILDYLGYDNDGNVGSFNLEDLPNIRRRLIKLKNGDVDQLTSPWQDEQGPARRTKDDDGVDRITRGPRVMGGQRTHSQVLNYADKLLSIIDFAQKNNAHVTWG